MTTTTDTTTTCFARWLPIGTPLRYTNLTASLTSTRNTRDADVSVQVRVTNTGRVASDEVAQAYASYHASANSHVEHPKKQLMVSNASTSPQGSPRASRSMPSSPTSRSGTSRGRFFVEPGSYTISAGRSSADADQLASRKPDRRR